MISVFRLMFCITIWAGAAYGEAQNMHAFVRVDASPPVVAETGQSVALEFRMTAPVPYRVFTLTDPARLVLDLNEADWSGFDAGPLEASGQFSDLRYGLYRPGWSRLVLDLTRPMSVVSAALDTNAARLNIVMEDLGQAHFADTSGAPPGAQDWFTETPKVTGKSNGILVALDPGHGGIDPGAIRKGVVEKDIALTFARDLRDILEETGQFAVFLTRDEDRFVALAHRVRLAQEAGADVFLSIHANTVTEGNASGATVYSLSEKASDKASQQLAELENRADISAGLDLSAEDDLVAKILIDMARTETNARSQRFAEALVSGMKETVGTIRSRPHRSAGFKVLKAPDMPSLLLELGFLSNPQDRRNMQKEAWRMEAARGVIAALEAWAAEDAALANFVMK